MATHYDEALAVAEGLRRDLATAETMHAAWRKRAEEAEASVEQARREERARCLYFVLNHRGNGKKKALIDKISSGQPAPAIRARGEAPTWTAEQVSHVSTEADRLAGKFSRGEGK